MPRTAPQPPIMRQQRAWINRHAALSCADPRTTSAWADRALIERSVSDGWLELAGVMAENRRCRTEPAVDCGMGQPTRSSSSPHPALRAILFRCERDRTRDGWEREVGCVAAAYARAPKKNCIRLTPFAALARFTCRGAVHGDLGLPGCSPIRSRHAKDSHATSQPSRARLAAERLLARTHLTRR